MKIFSSAIAFLVAFSLSSAARADNEAKYKEAYNAGLKCADAKDWKCAGVKFREALDIRENPNILIALGAVEQQLGHLWESRRFFLRSISKSKETMNKDSEISAQKALDDLLSLFPKIHLRLPTGHQASSVTENGKPLEKGGEFYLINPGQHKIFVEPDDQNLMPFEANIAANNGETIELKFLSRRRRLPSSSLPLPLVVRLLFLGLLWGLLCWGLLGLLGLVLGRMSGLTRIANINLFRMKFQPVI